MADSESAQSQQTYKVILVGILPYAQVTEARIPLQKTSPYTSYDQVPWHRKNWFVIICFFLFAPGLLLIFLTGDVYYKKNGQLAMTK